MEYCYDPNESSLKGFYKCNVCGNNFCNGNRGLFANRPCCDKGKDGLLTFVFGPKLVQLALTRAHVTGSENSIVYGGVSVELLKTKHPNALTYTEVF